MTPNIVFRLDASSEIGLGHAVRCYALSAALLERGCKVEVVTRVMTPFARDLFRRVGIAVHAISARSERQDAAATTKICKQTRANAIVVDHYGLGNHWEELVAGRDLWLVAIDDVARRHRCDILVDQNEYREKAIRYYGRVSSHTVLLLGLRYALLRREFRKNPDRVWPPCPKHILVSFGGTDPTAESGKVLAAAERLKDFDHFVLDVVISRETPAFESLEERISRNPNVRMSCNVTDMQPFMAKADVAFGAGGVTGLERLRMGLMGYVSIVAANQRRLAEEMHDSGWHICLGENVPVEGYERAFEAMKEDYSKWRMGRGDEASSLVDGRGADRVAEEICRLL